MDANEEKRKRDRDRYGRMTDEEKQEKLKRRREVYQKNKKIKEKAPDPRAKRCAQEKQRYANKQPEQKKARIEQVTANRELRRSTPCKESIAMVNPAYVAPQQEAGVSTLNVRQRKHVTQGERQTLLHRRNEQFSAKQRKTGSESSQEDTSMMNSDNDRIEPLKQPEVMINGIYHPLPAINKDIDAPAQQFSSDDEHDIPSSACPTNEDVEAVEKSFCNDDDHGNDQVIFERDTSEDEYMFSGQEWEPEVEIEIKEDKESSKPDPYDDVYRNIPETTHMLKTQEDCKLCGAKKFQYETKGLCCKNGNIKLANPETTPELMRF
ncbi:hypothetical protein ACQ4PT_028638 [Festuca glaucescens]